MRPTYQPNFFEHRCAWLVAGMRKDRMNQGTGNLPNGDPESELEHFLTNYAGAMGEIAASRILDLCWTGLGSGERGSDSRPDVGERFGVRTITAPHKGLVCRPSDDEAAYFLVFFDEVTRNCTLLGWATKAEVMERGELKDAHTPKPYWVLRKLHDIDELPQPIHQAKALCNRSEMTNPMEVNNASEEERRSRSVIEN